MHPRQRRHDDEEEQHEAARPQTREVEQRAEGNRQNEAAETTDQADQTADGADVVRIVDRDVLVDRRLPESHEEAENEDGDDEAEEAHLEMEAAITLRRVNDIVRRRIREKKRADDRDQEGPVHHRPGAVAV